MKIKDVGSPSGIPPCGEGFYSAGPVSVCSIRVVLTRGTNQLSQANIGQSIEASIVAKQRYTEAAYFRMDDNMKYAAMNEAERHPSSPSKPRPSAASMRQTPTLNLYEPPSLLRKDDWLRMLDEEFAEYDVDGIPPTLQVEQRTHHSCCPPSSPHPPSRMRDPCAQRTHVTRKVPCAL